MTPRQTDVGGEGNVPSVPGQSVSPVPPDGEPQAWTARSIAALLASCDLPDDEPFVPMSTYRAALAAGRAAATPDPPCECPREAWAEEPPQNRRDLEAREDWLAARRDAINRGDLSFDRGFISGLTAGRAAATPTPSDEEGWSPGIDDPKPPALGDIDTGEGWYQT